MILKSMNPFILIFVMCFLFLGACAGTLPGSTDATHKEFFQSEETLKKWIDELEIGMSEAEAFARLGRLKTDFEQLSRGEIVDILFGGRNAGVPPSFQPNENLKDFLDSLAGYRLTIKSVIRKHGFTSPIRVQTDSTGYDYTLNLVFKDGQLFEKPVLVGGKVSSKSSSTLFDFLTPGLAIDVVK